MGKRNKPARRRRIDQMTSPRRRQAPMSAATTCRPARGTAWQRCGRTNGVDLEPCAVAVPRVR